MGVTHPQGSQTLLRALLYIGDDSKLQWIFYAVNDTYISVILIKYNVNYI